MRFAFVFTLAFAAGLVSLRSADSPNIVTVFIDDMGWSDLSSFGGDRVVTEHIDRLAAEGIKFTNFYVNSPICSPSRVALTTGQYPQRWRITSYLNNRANNRERGMAQWLDPEAPVLARELHKAGYATGHFGKWHMGGQRDVDDAPPIITYGFNESLTNFEGMGAKLLPLTMTPDSDKPGRIWEKAEILGEPVIWMQRSEITKGFVDAALVFIDRAQTNDKPFYVNLWPDDVHGPWFPPLDKWGDGSKRELYYGVLDAMDDQLAPLFDRIRDDEKLRENTLIVFCSDNGHEEGAGMSDPLRGSKTWLYEGGIRSPLIVWGPGLIAEDAAGTTDDESIFSAIDLNRSLYALTNTPLPDGAELDGENVLDSMLGKSSEGRKAPIFFRRPPDRPGNDPKWGMGDAPDLAVRDGKWKFHINYDGSNPQLYDLSKDISESDNLAEENPEVVERLKKAVFEWNETMPADAGDPSYVEENGDKFGWRPLFNGKDLSGWHRQKERGQHGTGGNWGVTEDGVLFGEQDPPGSGNGGLLLTDEKFQNFEVELELRPDWGPDSGVFVRTDERGGGWQIYVDHHDHGNVGHIRLETKPYSVPFRPFGFSRIDPEKPALEMAVDSRTKDWPEGVYVNTCTQEEWLSAWRPDDWNRLKIRCTGRELPVIETWINGLKVCRFDAFKTKHPKYDRQRARDVIEPSGSIGLQVHGGQRWQAGERVYWRNLRVRSLD